MLRFSKFGTPSDQEIQRRVGLGRKIPTPQELLLSAWWREAERLRIWTQEWTWDIDRRMHNSDIIQYLQIHISNVPILFWCVSVCYYVPNNLQKASLCHPGTCHPQKRYVPVCLKTVKHPDLKNPSTTSKKLFFFSGKKTVLGWLPPYCSLFECWNWAFTGLATRSSRCELQRRWGGLGGVFGSFFRPTTIFLQKIMEKKHLKR